MNYQKDKEIEKNRYNSRASKVSNSIQTFSIKSIPKFLRKPYEIYHKRLKQNINKNTYVLELAAGMGEHTQTLVNTGANITITDISEESLKNIQKAYGNKLKTKVADIENLPFRDESFNLVCCAGSLSYGSHSKVRDEVYRVLKNDGIFICVDSLDNNIIYRLNRYFNYLRGKRSKSVTKRAPSLNLLKLYEEKFNCEKIDFFGAITWLKPILSPIIGINSFSKFSNWFDQFFNIKKSAFKFVMVLIKSKK
tara:strand:- start:449 stop:1201 length:753 start_codon:yes stop_codon:yes gene_type:complete